MNARIRTAVYTTLAGIAMLSVSCSDDENTVAPTGLEAVLATYTSAGSTNGPQEPAQPYSIIVELGVAAEALTVYNPPDPILFANREMEDGVIYDATLHDTANFDVIAERLTDGVDGTAYVGVNALGGGGSQMGPESALFDFGGTTRVGPDLKGFEIMGIRVIVKLEVTPNGPNWLMSYEYTVYIIGH